VDASYLTGPIALGEDDHLITDAHVLLAFDREGSDPVPGCSTKSGLQGEYTIDVQGIAPPKTSYKEYYLIVTKRGFQALQSPIAIGPLARSRRNTVVLRKEE
jgi:hypothetical protein